MSAFEGTPLNIVLRDCGVRAYLIAGVAIEVGIEPTVRHSADLGYIPIVVREACSAGNQAAGERALKNIAFAGDAFIVETDEVCSILNQHDPTGATRKESPADGRELSDRQMSRFRSHPCLDSSHREYESIGDLIFNHVYTSKRKLSRQVRRRTDWRLFRLWLQLDLKPGTRPSLLFQRA
jgi:Isochorismatase family